MPEGADDSRSGRAARNRPRRVADPLAPGAGVEAAAADAGRLERKQALAGGDARAAHADRRAARRRRRCARARARRAPLAARKRPSAARFSRVGQVDGAGHVAGDRVERLDLAGEALGAAQVDERSPAASARMTPATSSTIPGRGAGRTSPRAAPAWSVDTGRPSATQAAKPPSSTATASWPTHRSIHHRRARKRQSPRRSRRRACRCRCRAASVDANAAGEGSG